MKNFRSEGSSRRGGFGGRDRGGRGDRGGFGGGDRGGRGGFGGRDSGAPRAMHHAVCAECHSACEVPFRPTGDKPVYCSNCFADRSGRSEERNDRPIRFSSDRPAPAARLAHEPKADNGRLEAKIEALSAKLDKLVTLLTEKSISNVKIKDETEDAIVSKKAVTKSKAKVKKTTKKK